MGCTASKPAGANGGADGPEITSTPYATVYEVDGVRDIDGNPVDMKQFEGKVRRGGGVAQAGLAPQSWTGPLAG